MMTRVPERNSNIGKHVSRCDAAEPYGEQVERLSWINKILYTSG